MDSRTVKLFVYLGLPEEIVEVIDNYLINNYREEHHKKFRFYGFNVQNIIFPIRSPIHKWGDIYDRYRELDNYNVDMFGFPKHIKIYCNKKMINLIMKKRKECNGKISDKCLSAFVKDHQQAVIESGCCNATLFYYIDEEKYGSDVCSSDSEDELYSGNEEKCVIKRYSDEDYFACLNYGNDDLSDDDDVYSSDSQDVDYIIN